MFGPIPAKHLKLNDPYAPKPGLRIAPDGLILTVAYKNGLFDVPMGGEGRFHGRTTPQPQPRGILLSGAEVSVVGIVPTAAPGPAENGLIAVMDGLIAISVSIHPWRGQDDIHAMVVDVVGGQPIPLSSPEDALWFREWALSARFPDDEGFRIGSSS
jgi:hypothetical protein